MSEGQHFPQSTLYVDLDCLLDLRLGVLASFGLDAVEKAFAADYANRLYDEFPGVDTAAFKARYAQCEKAHLADAMVTPILRLVSTFANETLKAILTTPIHQQPKLLLNIYPYSFSEAEIATLISVIRARTQARIDIEVVNMSRDAVTPRWVKAHVKGMVVYDYWNWLDIHCKNGEFKLCPCPSVDLIAPMLYKDKEAAKANSEIAKAFTGIEVLASPLIGLSLYPISYFSADLAALEHWIKKQKTSA